MSEPYYLGAWVHVINVHWGAARFLTPEEYMRPFEELHDVNFRFGYFTTVNPIQFIEGNFGDSPDSAGYIPIKGLQYDRFDPPGYWESDSGGGYVVGDWHEPAPPRWIVPWPVVTVHIPFNGFVRTRVYPYDSDDKGNIVGWLDTERAMQLSKRSQVFESDILYRLDNVSREGAGNYTGIPMYLVRTKQGFIVDGDSSSNTGVSITSTEQDIYLAKGAVRIEGEETTSEDIYQSMDYDPPYLMVADVTTEVLGNNPTPIYTFSDDTVMLIYNGKGGCTGKMPLVYAPICNIGGIKLSMAATACIDQPTYSSSRDLLITSITIRKQQVTPA